MPRRFSFSFSIVGLLILILLGIISASAATNTVPATGASCSTRSIRANDLKPDECASLNLINIVTTDIGTDGNSLILGDVTTAAMIVSWVGPVMILSMAVTATTCVLVVQEIIPSQIAKRYLLNNPGRLKPALLFSATNYTNFTNFLSFSR
jgi:CBS domain containing-hemolysin-like protein